VSCPNFVLRNVNAGLYGFDNRFKEKTMCEAKEKIKVLFLCTGNSCRSQIAEGWAKHLKHDVIEAYSAGIRPIGLNPKTIKVMAEAGVDISDHTSKHIDELVGIDFDYVVTVCDNAREQCPVFPGRAKLFHKAFDDPYFATGSEEEIMAEFRRVRDQIKVFVEELPEILANSK
jgi:arsenate reductase